MSVEEFPPKVPCPKRCEYGACGDPGEPSPGPYGCGGCCRCMGGCRLEYEVEQMLIPETPEQAHQRERWDEWMATHKDGGPMPL